MKTIKVMGFIAATAIVIGCASQKGATPDFSKTSMPVTPRFDEIDQAFGYLTDAIGGKLIGSDDSLRVESQRSDPAGIRSSQSPEDQTRRNAQSAMDELDREIAGQQRPSSANQIRSEERYRSQRSQKGRSPGLDGQQPMVIAIADFATETGKITKLGRYISDKLSPHFAYSKHFTVLERALMDKVLQEQQFQVSAFVDEDSTIKFGKLVGAETIVSGTISDLGDVYYINAKAIDVAQGHLLAVADVEVLRSRRLAVLYQTELPHLNQPKLKTRVFRAQGIGIPSTKHQNPTLARAMALRAAKGDAMRNLAQQIQGVQLDSDTTIKDMMTQDDTIRIQMNTTLQGARVVQQRQNPDGSVEVEMEVELTEDLVEQLQGN